MIDILFVFWLLYAAPAFVSYIGVRYQFKNEWKALKPNLMSFVMVVVPVLNWGFSIFTIINIIYDELGKISYNADQGLRRVKIQEDIR